MLWRQRLRQHVQRKADRAVPLSRRHFIAATVCAGALPLPARASGESHTLLGCITGNDPAGYLRFARFLGRKPDLALLAFNQTKADALWSSVAYICQHGAQFADEGARILWSVPCPGARQLEAIVAGDWDEPYAKLFNAILAVSPADDSGILLRLPWEFNLASQENAAIDKNGDFNAGLFVQAFQRLAALAWRVSPRFLRIWCPNVCTMQLDPVLCWPGADYADVIAQDFYLQKAYNKPGDFEWFLNENRGLRWGAEFARRNGCPYGLPEWGMDSDSFAGDFNAAALWLKGLGPRLDHHCWWDRSEVADCRISDGTNPALAAAYRQQWG